MLAQAAAVEAAVSVFDFGSECINNGLQACRAGRDKIPRQHVSVDQRNTKFCQALGNGTFTGGDPPGQYDDRGVHASLSSHGSAGRRNPVKTALAMVGDHIDVAVRTDPDVPDPADFVADQLFFVHRYAVFKDHPADLL